MSNDRGLQYLLIGKTCHDLELRDDFDRGLQYMLIGKACHGLE